MPGTALGIAGTAKNTGKTTTMTTILQELDRFDLGMGITGIGYDGEERDNVTGLPKPRINLKPGQYIATTRKCLQAGSAGYRILAETGMMTPLGHLVYAKILKEGLVVVAGPSRTSQLKRVIKDLKGLGCSLILVDGALNRLTPLIATDGLIMATGAARCPELGRLVEETAAISSVLNLPVIDEWEEEEGFPSLPLRFIVDNKDLEILGGFLRKGVREISLPGLIAKDCWGSLTDLLLAHESVKQVVFPDPLKLLVNGEPQDLCGHFQALKEAGLKIWVQRKPGLLAITLNPFYPFYRQSSGAYSPAYVDGQLLLRKMRERLTVPVFDLLAEGDAGLMEVLTKHGFLPG